MLCTRCETLLTQTSSTYRYMISKIFTPEIIPMYLPPERQYSTRSQSVGIKAEKSETNRRGVQIERTDNSPVPPDC